MRSRWAGQLLLGGIHNPLAVAEKKENKMNMLPCQLRPCCGSVSFSPPFLPGRYLLTGVDHPQKKTSELDSDPNQVVAARFLRCVSAAVSLGRPSPAFATGSCFCPPPPVRPLRGGPAGGNFLSRPRSAPSFAAPLPPLLCVAFYGLPSSAPRFTARRHRFCHGPLHPVVPLS